MFEQAWEEAEEEEKKREEEEAKKAEEAGAGGAEAEEDSWGAFATVGKKKKGAKAGKVDLPAAETETKGFDLGASATADANPDDEWGGWDTGKSKKKKDAKKGKVRSFTFHSHQSDALDDDHVQC